MITLQVLSLPMNSHWLQKISNGSAILKLHQLKQKHLFPLSLTNHFICALDLLVSRIHKLDDEELTDNVKLMYIWQQGQKEFNLPEEFSHFVALRGLFRPSRNILKHWASNEELFIKLVKKEGKIGIDHFLQSLILYFVRVHKEELHKYAPTFMKKLVDEDIISDKTLIKWYDKDIRLDKDSLLYDKKAERHFREMIEKFIEWLR